MSETIADIINEKRTTAREIRSETSNQYRRELAVMLEVEADRIEAAFNQSVTNCNHFGNAEKMREALEKADAVLSLISKSAWFIDANFSVNKAVIEAVNAIEAALSAPPRNCDRPECVTTKDAQKVWRKEDGGKTAYYEWLLAKSTKGESNEAY